MEPLPLIGVSGSLEQDESRQSLLRDYLTAVLSSGGIPLVLSVDMNRAQLDACLRRLDGVLLAGGWDVDPALYGALPHAALGPVQPLRDRFEKALLTAAREAKMPVLGICRGVQVMNAFAGGTLYQDIPGQFAGDHGCPPILHSQTAPGRYPCHEVRLEAGSRLASLLRTETLPVNSFHHQAVRTVAPGLAACAAAPDGLTEAVEDSSHPFWIGVQWHPERMYRESGEAKALFDAFVSASAAYAKAGR